MIYHNFISGSKFDLITEKKPLQFTCILLLSILQKILFLSQYTQKIRSLTFSSSSARSFSNCRFSLSFNFSFVSVANCSETSWLTFCSSSSSCVNSDVQKDNLYKVLICPMTSYPHHHAKKEVFGALVVSRSAYAISDLNRTRRDDQKLASYPHIKLINQFDGEL